MLIPAEEFQTGGRANGRALAYLAHEHPGEVFGTFYDVSATIIRNSPGDCGFGLGEAWGGMGRHGRAVRARGVS